MFSLQKYSIYPLIWNCVRKYCTNIEPIEMAYTEFESEITDPSRPPLFIFHGILGSQQNWKHLANQLKKKINRKIYTFDVRNNGDSPHTPEHGPMHVAADLVYIMQKFNIEKAAMMGHSVGGMAMMYMALQHSQLVERLVVIDISPVALPKEFDIVELILIVLLNSDIPTELSLAQGRKYIKEKILHIPGMEMSADFILMNLRKNSDGTFKWAFNIETLTYNFRSYNEFLESVTSSEPYEGNVLYICGSKSYFVNPDNIPIIKTLLPNAEFKWLNSGHLFQIEKPSELLDLLEDFLK